MPGIDVECQPLIVRINSMGMFRGFVNNQLLNSAFLNDDSSTPDDLSTPEQNVVYFK